MAGSCVPSLLKPSASYHCGSPECSAWSATRSGRIDLPIISHNMQPAYDFCRRTRQGMPLIQDVFTVQAQNSDFDDVLCTILHLGQRCSTAGHGVIGCDSTTSTAISRSRRLLARIENFLYCRLVTSAVESSWYEL